MSPPPKAELSADEFDNELESEFEEENPKNADSAEVDLTNMRRAAPCRALLPKAGLSFFALLPLPSSAPPGPHHPIKHHRERYQSEDADQQPESPGSVNILATIAGSALNSPLACCICSRAAACSGRNTPARSLTKRAGCGRSGRVEIGIPTTAGNHSPTSSQATTKSVECAQSFD